MFVSKKSDVFDFRKRKMDDRKGRGIIVGYPCPEDMEKYVSSGTAGPYFPECMTEAKQTHTPHQPGNAGRWGVWQSERHAFISWESA